MIVHIIEAVYHFLWGDLVTLHLSGTSIGIPLLVLLLIPTGIYFTFRTNFVSVRLFPDMVRSLTEKKGKPHPEHSTCAACRNSSHYAHQISHTNPGSGRFEKSL